MKLVSVLLPFLLATSPVLAADADRVQQQEMERVESATAAHEAARPSRSVGSHYFNPTRLVPSPLVTSNFGLNTGIGTARVHVGEEDFQLAAYSQSLGGQVAIFDYWGVRAAASGFLFGGANEDSVYGYGANFGHAVSLGTTLSTRFRTLVVASTLDVAWVNDYALNIVQAVEQSVENQEPNYDSILSQSRTVEPLTGLSLAWGVSSILGLRTSLLHRTSLGKASSLRGELRPTAAIDLDFASKGVPLGAEFRYSQQNLAGNSRLEVMQGLLSMRYFWRVEKPEVEAINKNVN